LALATVSADDLDSGVGGEPVLDTGRLPVGQQVHGTAPLQVHEDGVVRWREAHIVARFDMLFYILAQVPKSAVPECCT